MRVFSSFAWMNPVRRRPCRMRLAERAVDAPHRATHAVDVVSARGALGSASRPALLSRFELDPELSTDRGV
jgi:hypothetical protein